IDSTLKRLLRAPHISGDLLGRPARLHDRVTCLGRECVGAHRQRAVESALAEHLPERGLPRDDSLRLREVDVDDGAPVEGVQRRDVDDRVLDLEARVREAALREPAEQRVLAALVAVPPRVAGARLLALRAAACGLPLARAEADALPPVVLARYVDLLDVAEV